MQHLNGGRGETAVVLKGLMGSNFAGLGRSALIWFHVGRNLPQDSLLPIICIICLATVQAAKAE